MLYNDGLSSCACVPKMMMTGLERSCKGKDTKVLHIWMCDGVHVWVTITKEVFSFGLSKYFNLPSTH